MRFLWDSQLNYPTCTLSKGFSTFLARVWYEIDHFFGIPLPVTTFRKVIAQRVSRVFNRKYNPLHVFLGTESNIFITVTILLLWSLEFLPSVFWKYFSSCKILSNVGLCFCSGVISCSIDSLRLSDQWVWINLFYLIFDTPLCVTLFSGCLLGDIFCLSWNVSFE